MWTGSLVGGLHAAPPPRVRWPLMEGKTDHGDASGRSRPRRGGAASTAPGRAACSRQGGQPSHVGSCRYGNTDGGDHHGKEHERNHHRDGWGRPDEHLCHHHACAPVGSTQPRIDRIRPMAPGRSPVNTCRPVPWPVAHTAMPSEGPGSSVVGTRLPHTVRGRSPWAAATLAGEPIGVSKSAVPWPPIITALPVSRLLRGSPWKSTPHRPPSSI